MDQHRSEEATEKNKPHPTAPDTWKQDGKDVSVMPATATLRYATNKSQEQQWWAALEHPHCDPSGSGEGRVQGTVTFWQRP